VAALDYIQVYLHIILVEPDFVLHVCEEPTNSGC